VTLGLALLIDGWVLRGLINGRFRSRPLTASTGRLQHPAIGEAGTNERKQILV
jgi:hypothetical protein